MSLPVAAKQSPDLLLRQVIVRRRIRAIYQPIVDLEGGSPVAYEALARGPEGSPLEMPGALFGAAADADMLAELDRACRDAAVEGALHAGLRPPHTLFVNIEPSAIGGSEPLLSHEDELAAGSLRVVVEFTERELAARATLLAEGIETEEHLARARAVGATLGQGWLFGRPGPLAPAPMIAAGVALRPALAVPAGTPFELIADRRRVRRGDKRLLLALSRQLEAEADGLGGEVVVLAAFQDARFFTTRSRDRYEQIARSAALVGALGAGMSEEPAPRVRGADLQRDEALHGEWDVVVISPHFAGAFVARDLGDAGVADRDRRFDFFVTYERELVARAAHALMARVYPQRTGSASSP
jgi:EAL domain-containing protein (putative c-di-GMP-specific phosphodiesterase class I)